MVEEFNFDFKSYAQNVSRLNQCVEKVDQVIEISAKYFVDTGIREIKMRASGRPGPNVITDTLRSGYQGDIAERQKLFARAHIWNPVAYAPYVEFMNGGQYTHFRPGIEVAIRMTESFYKEKLQEAMQ
jgi:hypothetical protein